MKRTLLSILVLISIGMHLNAQSIELNTRFGKVSKEELKMNSYDRDTSANAVMLYENTDVFMNIGTTSAFELTRVRHMRIKVLKEEGVNWGDFEFIYFTSSTNFESFNGIEVNTYNLVDDKIVVSKMPKKFVFDEKFSDNYRKLTFSAQDVKVGSVIEVKFTIKSSMYWQIDDVFFQRSIPVNLAECTIKIPDCFTFNKKMNGYHQIDYSSDMESFMGGAYTFKIGIDHFKTSDIPAFRLEPFVYNTSQYLSSIHYDIRSLTIPGVIYEDFSRQWSDVDHNFMESEMMKKFRSDCRLINEVKSIDAGLSDEEKIVSVVKLVKNVVQWNKEYRLFPEELSKTLSQRSGSNADINCLVAGCLRELGFRVDPVFIKFRTSGVLMEFQPELNPYDTFILRIKPADADAMYIDCGASEGYINILDPLMLIKNGRHINKEGIGQWIDLTRLCRNATVMSVTEIVGTEPIAATGNVSLKYFGEDAYVFKNYYHSFKDEESYIDDLENDHGIDIRQLAVKNKEEFTKESSVAFTYSKDLESSGNMIYINPFFDKFHSKDSFQSMTREYPVDFPYPYTIQYSYTLLVPQGYSVEQIPEPKTLTLDKLNSVAKLVSISSGNTIQIMFTYNQKETFGAIADYELIRTFWQLLAETYDSMIVLKKN